MRIKNDKSDISYDDTSKFFDNRVKKFKNENPYSVTMYQDKNPNLVRERNEKETKKLIPKLELNEKSKVLDVACGIGRYSDAIKTEIEEYCGLDFCEGLIDIARERNKGLINRHFYISRNEFIAEKLKENKEGTFDRILLIGALVYLNDSEVLKTLSAIESVCMNKAIICIREPIGIEDRLTLKENYSEELEDTYNAIYRTRDELVEMFQRTLINKGFKIVEEDFLFKDQNLNNRKETTQYYFILKR